jgi:HK97 family phage major capsid protein
MAIESKRISLRQLIDDQATGRVLSGFAREHSEEIARSSGIGRPSGVFVGWADLLPLTGKRDLNVTTASQGGALVGTVIDTEIVELLRNRINCLRLGAQMLTLSGPNVAIPRQNSPATAYSLPESATVTKSTQAIDQILLTPHRVSASTEYSKQLILQSSVDVENFIRDDLMKVLAIKFDSLMLNGSGSGSEPTGIMNTEGIGSVLFNTPATWAKVVSFETSLSKVNADPAGAKLAFLTTPGVRGAWKTIPKIASSAYPIFLWEEFFVSDGSGDGKVNGYRAAVTNSIPNDQVIFGNWKELIFAQFGSFDVVVNPYSRDIDAMVRITVNCWVDIAIRHAASFTVSADSGAQS